jgi:putative peptidoglycan lipid II flippase
MALGALAEAAWLAGVARLAAGVGLAGLLPVPAGLAGTGAAFGPVLAGEAMVAFNLVVDKAFAGTLPSGSVTILEYADRARLIPQTLVEATLLPVAFTAWSAARARDLPRADAVRGSLRIVALVLPPVVAGLTVGRSALVHVLFERGAFDAAASSAVARTLAAFLPGVVFSAWGALVVRAHIVEGRYRLVMGLGACSFALNAGLDLLLLRHGTVGLAVSTTLTTALITVYSWSRLGVGARLGWDGWGVVAASTLLAAVLGPEDLRLSPGMLVAALPFVGLLAFGAWRAR